MGVDIATAAVQRRREPGKPKKQPSNVMAKLRKKTGPIETACREMAPGVWEFETNQFRWQYREVLGLNLFALDKDDEANVFMPMLHVKNLDHAVLFAQGYDGGFGYALRTSVEK